jgi:hypothetical protein
MLQMEQSMVSIDAGSKETLTAVHESSLSRGTWESSARYGLKWGLILALVWVIGAAYTASLFKGDGFLTTKAFSRNLPSGC